MQPRLSFWIESQPARLGARSTCSVCLMSNTLCAGGGWEGQAGRMEAQAGAGGVGSASSLLVLKWIQELLAGQLDARPLLEQPRQPVEVVVVTPHPHVGLKLADNYHL